MQRSAVGKEIGMVRGGTVTWQFTQLYRELFPPLYAYVCFRVGDPQVAEDVTAQVFERALTRMASVRQPERVQAWLFTIARNAVTDYYRSHRPMLRLEAIEEMEDASTDSPETEAVRRDEAQRLSATLAGLGEREREVIGLKFAAGLTNRAIAQILDLSEVNVAQIIYRAMSKLRHQFAEEAIL